MARSEYLRLSTDKAITLEKVMTIPTNAIYDDLKRFRNRISQMSSSLTQYHLMSTTPDNVIEELSRDQCIYSLTQYCVQQGVQVNHTFYSSMSHFQLHVEVTKARDQLKPPSRSPNESNQPGSQTTHHCNTTASDKNPRNSSTKNKTRATPRELADNLNGVNASDFDPFKNKPSHDVRGPPKAPSDKDDVDEGHDAVSAERTIQTLNAKLETGEKNLNIPKVIKQLAVQLRKGDPMVTIMPFQNSTFKSSETFGKEQ